VFLLTQTRLTTFGARVGFVTMAGILDRDRDQRLVLELVRLPVRLHRFLHVHPSGRIPSRRIRRRARAWQANSTKRSLASVVLCHGLI
jgi:hypothetical protein